jgi:hypothetical protein
MHIKGTSLEKRGHWQKVPASFPESGAASHGEYIFQKDMGLFKNPQGF